MYISISFSTFAAIKDDKYWKIKLNSMKQKYSLLPFFLIFSLLLVSCIKDEPQNMECDILEAWVDGSQHSAHFYQTTDMRQSVSSVDQTIEFTVRSLSELPPLALHFQLTPGATITPADGSVHDFTQGPVAYTVTSEDGQWHRTYTIGFRNASLPNSEFDFEHSALDAGGHYYEWYEQSAEGNRDYIWATGNAGFIIAKPNAAANDYPTVPEANGYDGACVRLTTCSTGSWGKLFKKPIAAGNLFLGAFDSNYALTNTLWTTQMGIPYSEEPARITGYYKYKPGSPFTDKDGTEHADQTDEPSIYAVFYRNHDADGNAIVLHGDDVQTNSLIVRKAQVASLPATDEWKPFEMTFKGTEAIDPTLLDSRGYSLALVFSSSKNGDTFEGAVGSTLYIDKVELYYHPKNTIQSDNSK